MTSLFGRSNTTNFGSGALGLASTASASNEPKDIEVADPPGDSISSLAFSSVGEYLAAGSWNNEVRIYEVNPQNGQTQGKAMHTHQGPVLNVCWNKEGNKLFSGGADNAARLYDLATGQASQVAQHDAPVKCVRWIDAQGGILATGSWDKTLKYWDLRSSNPVATVQLPERCYTMDAVYPLLVVGMADKNIQVFNLTDPTRPMRSVKSPLKFQTRVVTCFPSADGYAIGSIEGRVAMQYIDEKKAMDNYSFRCHRTEQGPQKSQALVYSVNDINFHPVQGTFSTSGADGTVSFWDKDARIRLKTFDAAPGSISSTAFSRTGDIFAYAVSYDWSRGHTGMTSNYPNKIMLHACKEAEVKKRVVRK